MKHLSIFLLLACHVVANAQITTITPGSKAPFFELKNVTGKNVSFESFNSAKGYIVIFTCNTCPVAKAYEQRIIDLNTKYAPLGFPVIAINPNDPSISSGDSYEKMVERAKEKGYAFPYLYDADQKVTNAYGAKSTPHIFLVKRTDQEKTIVYTGAIDNDPENEKQDKTRYLEQAIDAVTGEKAPEVAVTKAIGCTVRRKSK